MSKSNASYRAIQHGNTTVQERLLGAYEDSRVPEPSTDGGC